MISAGKGSNGEGDQVWQGLGVGENGPGSPLGAMSCELRSKVNEAKKLQKTS